MLPWIKNRKTITRDEFRAAAKECGYPELIGLKVHEALTVYAGDSEKITIAFLRKIPDDQIETIKGVKIAGHKIVNYLKAK